MSETQSLDPRQPSYMAPTALAEALKLDGTVPFMGTAAARGGTNALTGSITAVGVALEPRTAQRIIALAEVTAFAQRMLGVIPNLSIPSHALVWLHKRVRTTLPDVMLRSLFEDADDAGELIPAEMSEFVGANESAGVSLKALEGTTCTVAVDLATDTARWTLEDSGFIVESAPLPLSVIRHIVEVGAQLGHLDAENSAGRPGIHIVQEIWKGLAQDPSLFTTVKGAAVKMADLAAERGLTLGFDGEEITLNQVQAGEIDYISDADQNTDVRMYLIPLAEINER
ncbi:MAG: hypothetical protein ACR2M1_05285 [Gemmatimonadaceae bacterium]